MDDPESQESLLESHYEQQRGDDEPVGEYERRSVVGSKSQQLPAANAKQTTATNRDHVDDVLILEDDCQEQRVEPIDRVPDVVTKVNSRGRGEPDKYKSKTLFHFDDSYLKSLDGVLKLIQIIMTLTSLICVVSSGTGEGGYLNLPLSWHLRIFLFTLVASFLMSLVIVFLYSSSLIRTMAVINWSFVELIIYSVLTVFLLVGASFVANTVNHYQNPEVKVTQWTINQLLSAVVLGYGSVCLYGATAVIGYCRWKRDQQRFYGTYQLQNTRSDSAEALA